MAFSFSKSIIHAASAGLILGSMTGCGGSQPPAESPSAGSDSAPAGEPAAAAGEGDQTAAGAGAKECCKGKNECKAKGGCKTDANSCAGQNECKGKGGCSGHCPK